MNYNTIELFVKKGIFYTTICCHVNAMHRLRNRKNEKIQKV